LSLFNELKRRNVFRVGAAYVVATWLVIQVAETIFPLFGFGDTPARVVVIVLAIGFIPAMILAWAFELTPEGLKKESEVDRTQSIAPHTGKKLDRAIMVVLALALGYFAFDKFVLSESREATMVEAAREEGRSEALVESYGEKSIVVLPFVNMSSDQEQEYFSDGISEELLNLLSKIPELRVISRSSAFSYKGKDVKATEIGRELNVNHILEGSVRKAGNRIRITAQLIEAHSDTHLWSETYDRTLDNIFQIQDELAEAVVAELKITLLGSVSEPRKTDPEVYSLYLQGNYFNNLRDKESLDKAQAAFEEALAGDPDYAPAWVGLSMTYQFQTRSGERNQEEGSELAMQAARRALEIDDSLAMGWSTLAYLKRSYEWDWAGAQAAIEKALVLEPNNANVLGAAASLSNTFGDLPKSIKLFEQIIERDPLDLGALRALAQRYIMQNRLDEALERSYQQRIVFLVFILGNQWLKGLHSDPRFPAFLEQMGLLEYWNVEQPE
jgi:adenylate cyclase